MKKIIGFFKDRVNELKNDKILLMIMFLHIILIVCHVSHSLISEIKYYGDLRTAGCAIIAALIFFFGRKGMSYGFAIYSCSLIYVNTFYNYGSIFLMLVAIGANPPRQKLFIVAYLINVAISFSIQHLLVFSAAIHLVYIMLFWLCVKYVFKVNVPTGKLKLNDDERKILDELLEGKMQKEIMLFSPQTITAKLKSARDKNLCESTSELLAKYAIEKESAMDESQPLI